MIEFSTIETLIMAYAPLLVTIIGIIVAFLKMIKIMRELKADNKLSNEEKQAQIDQLRADMQNVIDQNYGLKQQLKELLTKIDHVKRD